MFSNSGRGSILTGQAFIILSNWAVHRQMCKNAIFFANALLDLSLWWLICIFIFSSNIIFFWLGHCDICAVILVWIVFCHFGLSRCHIVFFRRDVSVYSYLILIDELHHLYASISMLPNVVEVLCFFLKFFFVLTFSFQVCIILWSFSHLYHTIL